MAEGPAAPSEAVPARAVEPSADEAEFRAELTRALAIMKKMEARMVSSVANQAVEEAQDRRAGGGAQQPDAVPEIAGGSAAAARETVEQWQNFKAGQPRGRADERDELDAAEYPAVPRRFRPQGDTTDCGGVDLPCGRNVKKKRRYLAPRCLMYRETGQTKMCDGCEMSLSLNIVSAACPRCKSRYHQECVEVLLG